MLQALEQSYQLSSRCEKSGFPRGLMYLEPPNLVHASNLVLDIYLWL